MCKGYTRKTVYIVLFYLIHSNVFAHGGVFLEDDLCVIQIGFFKAHFTIYQPETSGNEEYCEDIPNTGSSIFVLEYLHESLKHLPVDFRIIRNVTDLGRATSWTDIAKLKNLDPYTEFYQSGIVAQNGTLQSVYYFMEKGHYVGIITTQQPGNEKIYRAIFPFTVGVTSYSFLPLFIGLLLLVEIFYLYSNGTLQQWYKKYKNNC